MTATQAFKVYEVLQSYFKIVGTDIGVVALFFQHQIILNKINKFLN